MVAESLHTEITYRLFLKNLNALLKESGIEPFRQPITANADRKKNGTEKTSDTQPTIGRVIIYIEEHLTEQLSLDKLAEEARLSKYQLIRQFRDEKGTTPWKFLVGKRIEKVKKLLENGVPPSQAAVEAGFYDQSHLNKKFREETEQTPKEYQEEHFKNRN